MKLKYSFSQILLRVFQIALGLVAYITYDYANYYADQLHSGGGLINVPKISNIPDYYDFYSKQDIVNGTSLTSGLNGGAIGMALITVVCIYCIVLIELKIFQKQPSN